MVDGEQIRLTQSIRVRTLVRQVVVRLAAGPTPRSGANFGLTAFGLLVAQLAVSPGLPRLPDGDRILALEPVRVGPPRLACFAFLNPTTRGGRESAHWRALRALVLSSNCSVRLFY